MAAAETARLVASLELDTKKFTAGIGRAGKALGGLSGSIAKSRAVAVGLGTGLERAAEKGISALGGAIADGIAGAQELERAQAQTQAVIQSTGGAAGVTAQQVRDLANAQEDLTTADDKTVQQGENLLLTFTNIGKTVFPAATEAMVNMAIALNKGDAATADFDGTAIQLGKALNDPVKGLTALRKVGVSFTKDQEKRIKQFVKEGKVTEAQKVILAELTKEFGKAGKAAGTGFTADVNRANDAIEDAKIAIAQGLMPAVGEVARELSTVLKDPKVIQGLKDFGTGIGEAIKGLVTFAKQVPWGSIATSLQAAAGFAKDLLNAFLGLPDWVKTAVITGWGLNKLTGGALGDLFSSLASGLIKGVLGINAGVVNVNAATVNGGGAPGVVPGGAGGASSGSTLLNLAQSVLQFLPIAGIAAIAAKAAADQANTEFAAHGAKVTLEAPGGFFGIPAALNNIGQILGAIDAHNRENGPGSQGDFEGRRGQIGDQLFQAELDVKSGIEGMRGDLGDKLFNVESAAAKAGEVNAAAIGVLQSITASGDHSVQGQIASTGSTQYAATVGGTSQIVGAINSIPAPITTVNVYVTGTTVTRKKTVQDRGGRSGGDRNTPRHEHGATEFG